MSVLQLGNGRVQPDKVSTVVLHLSYKAYSKLLITNIQNEYR